MRVSYIILVWLILTLLVITISTVLAPVFIFPLFNLSQAVSLIILVAAVLLISGGIRRLSSLFFMKGPGVIWGLITPPVILLIASLPSTLLYLKPGSSEAINNNTFLEMLFFLGAFLYISTILVLTIPALSIMRMGFKGSLPTMLRRSILVPYVLVLFAGMVFLFADHKSWEEYTFSYHIIALPFLAIVNMITLLVLYIEFKREIRYRILDDEGIFMKPESEEITEDYTRFQKSSLLFQSHYLDIISGSTEYLSNQADDNYAESLIESASRNFDPALLPALKVIRDSGRFKESLQQAASLATDTIEKYFNDPRKNRDLVIQSGQTEKVVNARLILTGKRVPEESEVIRLLHDNNKEIRKIGLATAGLFRMNGLLEEIIQALSVHDTEKEAFFLLQHFGTDTYNDLAETYLKQSGSEKMGMMVARLLGPSATPESLSVLSSYLVKGPVGARTRIVRHLNESGFKPSADQRKELMDVCLDLIGNMARIISFQVSARKSRFFLLDKALQWEREMNDNLLRELLLLLTGRGAIELLYGRYEGKEAFSTRFMAEVIKIITGDPLKRPLLALKNNNTDHERLRQLSKYFPVKEDIKNASIAGSILSSDQSIAGVWTKACVLRKVAEGKLKAEKELLITFLFSQRLILQEEAARALLTTGTDWFGDVSDRLTLEVRQRTVKIIDKSQPEPAMMFNKVRFLTLCFNRIPEERMLFLASRMTYSHSYDSRPLPGYLTWVVPIGNDKSGLYSLSVNVLADFIFHFSEYTDIFVDYIDNIDRESVSQIVSP